MKFDASKLVVEAEASAEILPRGTAPEEVAVVRYIADDDYDPGPNPAQVGGSLGFTSSRDYQSLKLEVRCTLPSRPNSEDVQARGDLALALCKKVLAAQAPYLTKLGKALGTSAKVPEIVEFDGAELVQAAEVRREG